MKLLAEGLSHIVAAAKHNAKMRKGMVSLLAIFFILQVYFVRELLAAELLFVFFFAVLLAMGGIFYLVGAIGERGLDFIEPGVRVVVDSARRGYNTIEEISKKPFRQPESAQ
jgi:uncharacterized membrane protein HdeD (DUF308 family)